MLQVKKHYNLGLQGCDFLQNIPYPSQTAKQEKFTSSQNLLTYLFIICLTTLSAAQGHVAPNNSTMSELVNNQFLQNVKGGGSGLI
jgi:hypothetical protein